MILSLMLVANTVMLGVALAEEKNMTYFRSFIIVGFLAFVALALGEAIDMIFVALLGATYQGYVLMVLDDWYKDSNEAAKGFINGMLVGTPFVFGIVYVLTAV